MEPPASVRLTALATRLANPASWLGGADASQFATELAQAGAQIDAVAASAVLSRGPAVVSLENSTAFLGAALATIVRGIPVALASPRWGEIERAQAAEQLRPGLWFGNPSSAWPSASPKIPYDAPSWRGAIFIPTGGTSGRIRWAIHNWATLATAARALEKFLPGGPFTHVSTLPPWHVSGFMPAVRAIETGGKFHLENWKSLEAGTPPNISPAAAVISLVPTQLARLPNHPAVVAWLRESRAILLGGAAPSPSLLTHARDLKLPVALAYGMTETAAVAAAQTPVDFLAGAPPLATPLAHAHIWIGDDSSAPLPLGAAGRIWIESDSLASGYYPTRRPPGPFATDDCGTFDHQGRLNLLGRLDRQINSGGEKIHPALVEAAILATGLVEEILVHAIPDEQWGQQVVALYTGKKQLDNTLTTALAGKISPAAIPKSWLHFDHLPFDERGKLDRASLDKILPQNQSPS